MGNSSTTSSKASSSPVSSLPAWAQTGTTDYNNMNSALQTAPMNAALQTIGSGGLGQTSQNAMNTLGSSTGTNSWMNTAANGLQNTGTIDTSSLSNLLGQANNAGTVSEDYYKQLYGNAGQSGAASQYLTSTANGDYLDNNPYIDSIISKGAGDIASNVSNMFASGGRYGSGANQGVLSDSIADYANNLRYQNYSDERANQLAAANSLESAEQARLGLQNSAAAGLAGVQGTNVSNNLAGTTLASNIASQIGNFQNQNIQNGLSANTALGNLGQNAVTNQQNALNSAAGIENQGMGNLLNMISQLPTIQGNKTYDAQQQAAVGSSIDSTAQQALQNAISQWSQADNEDWSRIGALLSAASGSASNYGTQTGTSTSTQPANILGALGSLLAAPVTGGGSVFGSLFSASDRSLKENIQQVGSENGFPIYDFSYIGRPERYRGVMAQDVIKTRPDAVAVSPSGHYMVNYAALGLEMKRVA